MAVVFNWLWRSRSDGKRDDHSFLSARERRWKGSSPGSFFGSYCKESKRKLEERNHSINIRIIFVLVVALNEQQYKSNSRTVLLATTFAEANSFLTWNFSAVDGALSDPPTTASPSLAMARSSTKAANSTAAIAQIVCDRSSQLLVALPQVEDSCRFIESSFEIGKYKQILFGWVINVARKSLLFRFSPQNSCMNILSYNILHNSRGPLEDTDL